MLNSKKVGDPVRLVHVLNAPFALQYVRGQARYMRERGINVTAITSPGDGLAEFGTAEEVPVYGIPIVRKISPIVDLVSLIRLVWLWRRMRPEIVHAHTPKGGLLGLLSAALARVPVRVYTIHGLTYMTAAGASGVLLRWTDRISCRLAHRVICVSPSIQQVAIEDRICPPGKMVVLAKGSANGVDAIHRFNPDRFTRQHIAALRRDLRIGEDDLVITFIGRIVQDKGIDELAEAWRRLRARYPHLHLLLVGPVEERDAVKPTMLQALKDDERAHMLGFHEDVSELLAISDVIAVPSAARASALCSSRRARWECQWSARGSQAPLTQWKKA